MSFENPTPLRVGAKGTLHGWTVTVAGRVVLGVEIAGERYYWNEFNLVDASGHSGTLVYEEGDDGPEWKLFQLITPRTPLTISEAETKRVGDEVSFGGKTIPVTLVDRSRVHHIEGTAPEGVEVGDLADFFNADAGDHMIVASWTGNEIEFYEGRDVPATTIASAFGLPQRGKPARRSERRFQPAVREMDLTKLYKGFGIIVAVVVVLAVVVANWPWWGEPDFNAARVRLPLPPALRLANGASGVLGQQSCTVVSQALVEVGRIGGKFERREYQLTSEGREHALLINGLTGGIRQWHLLRPVPAPATFTAYDAAAQRKGARLNLGGAPVTVAELFLSQPRSAEGAQVQTLWPAGKHYGFLAMAGGDWWLARWNERNLLLYRGTPLDEKTVFAALGPGPEKPK